MKYLIILFFSFLVASQASAVHIIPGAVPSIPPLQPIPPGAGANYAGNVESQNTPAEDSSSTLTGEQSEQVTPTVLGSRVRTASGPNSHAWVWWAAVLVLGVGGALIWLNKYGKK